MTPYLAIRNLLLQRRRYALMAAAVVVGFLLVTILTAAAQGAMETIQSKGARYFSGHVSVTGFRQNQQVISDPLAVVEAVQQTPVPLRTVAPRVIYYRRDARLFFGGNSVRQRRLVGVDFEAEGREIATLDFRAGGIEPFSTDAGENGVLISEVVAELLSARLGDDITVLLTTDDGQINTVTLVVHGIFREAGIFGYVTYMRMQDLNQVLGRPAHAATDVAVYLRNPASLPPAAEAIRTGLADRFAVFPPVLHRRDFSAVVDRNVQQETLAVVSLDAQLAEIRDLVDAFLMVSNFVVALFMVIVMFGILNTYRVLLHQRTREIGTMRALGMSRGGIMRVFLIEAAFLAVLASFVGFLIATVLLSIGETVSVGTGPAVAMFTERGRLQFSIRFPTVATNLLLMVGAVLVAAWGPAYKASRLHPVEALRKDT